MEDGMWVSELLKNRMDLEVIYGNKGLQGLALALSESD